MARAAGTRQLDLVQLDAALVKSEQPTWLIQSDDQLLRDEAVKAAVKHTLEDGPYPKLTDKNAA